MNTVQSTVGRGTSANPIPQMAQNAAQSPSALDSRQNLPYVHPVTGEPDELWKPLTGFESDYKISNLGKVVKLSNSSLVKTWADKDGNQAFIMLDESKAIRTTIRIHRAVALAFLPNPNGFDWVTRKVKNGNRNELSNLEWKPSPKQVAAQNPVKRSEPKLSFTDYTLNRLVVEGRLTPQERNLAAIINIMDDSMAPRMDVGTQAVIVPVSPADYSTTTGIVAVVVQARLFAFYLGRVVSIGNDVVHVSRDNAQWSERIESRGVISRIGKVVCLLNAPIS